MYLIGLSLPGFEDQARIVIVRSRLGAMATFLVRLVEMHHFTCVKYLAAMDWGVTVTIYLYLTA